MNRAITQVSRKIETPVRYGRLGKFSYRYAYARSADSRKDDDAGQDYLTFSVEEQTCAFALCDGVSQSFYGELAAMLLGDALLKWLRESLPTKTDAKTIQTVLTEYLNQLSESAIETIKNHPLPHPLAPMLREVLEGKRAFGSESMFVCGRVDLPSETSGRGRVVLAQMGDSRVRLGTHTSELTADAPKQPNVAQRWSTRRGLIGGLPQVWVKDWTAQDMQAIEWLAAYSDGLTLLDDQDCVLSSQDLQALIDEAAQTATSDDISLWQVWLTSDTAKNERE